MTDKNPDAARLAETRGAEHERKRIVEMLREPDSRQLFAVVAKVIGECICSQIRLEKVGEGDTMRAHFILPGKALDFSMASIEAARALADLIAEGGK